MSRFDWRYELNSMYRGMSRDMQQPVGQTIPWYVFDGVDTVDDSIYDVGSIPVGRKWYPPRYLQAMNVIKLEGQQVTNDEGYYTLDTLTIIFSADAARQAGLGDLILKPDAHDRDRIVYEGKVFEPGQVRIRGIITAGYAICGVDCVQVKQEELVNDSQFQAYIATDNG